MINDIHSKLSMSIVFHDYKVLMKNGNGKKQEMDSATTMHSKVIKLPGHAFLSVKNSEKARC